MGKIQAETFSLADLVREVIFVPDRYCKDCPMYADEAPWCGWYKRRVNNPDRSEFCRVKCVKVEVWGNDY